MWGKDFGETCIAGSLRGHREGLVSSGFGVSFDPMSASRPTAPQVTFVTAALGLRLPLTRELCCRHCRS